MPWVEHAVIAVLSRHTPSSGPRSCVHSQSLHFSPLIELLECKRGPRCLREFNMPCRRATKNAVKLCKGPDNEFKSVRRLQRARVRQGR